MSIGVLLIHLVEVKIIDTNLSDEIIGLNWEEQVPEQIMHRIPGLQDKQQFICTVGLPSVVILIGRKTSPDTKRRNSPAGSFPYQQLNLRHDPSPPE